VVAKKPEYRTIYQRVGARWSYTPAEPWGDETPRSNLIFISPLGMLDGPTLEARLKGSLADRSYTLESA